MPVYELRTYHALPGRLDALLARFARHTDALILKHGMKTLAYWVPSGENPARTLVYLVEHASLDAAEANWTAFNADPEWKRVKAETEFDGPITASLESLFLDQVDLSKFA